MKTWIIILPFFLFNTAVGQKMKHVWNNVKHIHSNYEKPTYDKAMVNSLEIRIDSMYSSFIVKHKRKILALEEYITLVKSYNSLVHTSYNMEEIMELNLNNYYPTFPQLDGLDLIGSKLDSIKSDSKGLNNSFKNLFYLNSTIAYNQVTSSKNQNIIAKHNSVLANTLLETMCNLNEAQNLRIKVLIEALNYNQKISNDQYKLELKNRIDNKYAELKILFARFVD